MAVAVQKHNETTFEELYPGDLVEFKRGMYSHWAVYKGKGRVIHLAGDENDGLNANLNSGNIFTICGRRFNKAFVREDDFWEVTGDSKAYKNNKRDQKMTVCAVGHNRSLEQVKKKWTDLKSMAKKKEMKRRRMATGTGGGPAPPELSALEEQIISVIPDEMVEGIPGGLDTFASKPKKARTEEKTETLTSQLEGDVACMTSPKQCSSKDQTSEPAMIKASCSSSRSKKVLERKEKKCDIPALLLEQQMETNQTLKEIYGHLAELVRLKQVELELKAKHTVSDFFSDL